MLTCSDPPLPLGYYLRLHLDYAQDEASIKRAASMPFDSIMVDMSHYEKIENLRRTADLVQYCHKNGVATEAELGRINGGEDSVKDTGEPEEMPTTANEALEVIDTGVDFQAPGFDNGHGKYYVWWGGEH